MKTICHNYYVTIR